MSLRGRLTVKAVKQCAECLLGIWVLGSSGCRVVLLGGSWRLLALGFWDTISSCSNDRGGGEPTVDLAGLALHALTWRHVRCAGSRGAIGDGLLFSREVTIEDRENGWEGREES
jgi:hypothetical protein